MNKRSKVEWQSLFEQHAASGLSAAAFCREHGLCPKYFSLRRKQLRGDTSDTQPAKTESPRTLRPFIPTRLQPQVRIVIELGELTVSLPASVEAGWLSDFVVGLRA